MPIGRRALSYLGQRMNLVMNNVVLAKLADLPSATVVMPNAYHDDDDERPFAQVSPEVGIGVVDRSKLLELRDVIDRTLEACKNDNDF